MIGKNRVSLYQEQKKTKPKAEDVVNELLEGDRKRDALAPTLDCAKKMVDFRKKIISDSICK